jgi:hypothetical protein
VESAAVYTISEEQVDDEEVHAVKEKVVDVS